GRDFFCSMAADQRIQSFIFGVKHTSRTDVNLHFLRYRERLDHGTAGSNVSAQNRNPPARAEWIGAGPDDFVERDLIVVQIPDALVEEAALLDFREILTQSLSRDREAIEMKEISQFEHQPRKPTGVPEVFNRITPRRFHVSQYRDLTMDAIEGINRDVDAGFVGNGRKMNQGVRGPARGGMNNDGVLERFSRQDVASADVFLDEPHARFAGRPR